MKIFLPFLLSVVLVVSLTVPALASENDDLLGTWRFNSTVDTSQPLYVLMDFYDGHEDQYTFLKVNNLLNEISYEWTGVYGDDVWAESELRTITITTITDEDSEKVAIFRAWLKANAVKKVCDGSSCPATDANKDNVCDDCGFEFAVPRDYYPFTVKKFMNHIGQILTSAVSWVGNVGSTILQQPLLLAFCVLPLCGIGIGIFKRLKTAS